MREIYHATCRYQIEFVIDIEDFQTIDSLLVEALEVGKFHDEFWISECGHRGTSPILCPLHFCLLVESFMELQLRVFEKYFPRLPKQNQVNLCLVYILILF